MSYYGQFADIAPALAMLPDLRAATGLHDDQLAWVLPESVLPGVTRCYGLPVVRADVPEPLIGVAPYKVVR